MTTRDLLAAKPQVAELRTREGDAIAAACRRLPMVEDSPEGWPQPFDSNRPGDAFRLAGRSDDLGNAGEARTDDCCHETPVLSSLDLASLRWG